MVEYTCEKCNKTFNQKNDYTRHLNRKVPCVADDFYNSHKLLLEKIATLESENTELKKRLPI